MLNYSLYVKQVLLILRKCRRHVEVKVPTKNARHKCILFLSPKRHIIIDFNTKSIFKCNKIVTFLILTFVRSKTWLLETSYYWTDKVLLWKQWKALCACAAPTSTRFGVRKNVHNISYILVGTFLSEPKTWPEKKVFLPFLAFITVV